MRAAAVLSEGQMEIVHAIRRTFFKQEAYERGIYRAIRVYTMERQLVSHVEACTRWNNDGTPLNEWVQKKCGKDGWYCEIGSKYRPPPLEKSALPEIES